MCCRNTISMLRNIFRLYGKNVLEYNLVSFPVRFPISRVAIQTIVANLSAGFWRLTVVEQLMSRIASTYRDTHIHNRCTRQLLQDLIDELVITSSTRDGQGTERKADAVGETRNARMDEKQTRRKNMEQKRRKWKEDKQKMVAVLFDRESMEISTDVMPLLKLNQLSATFLHLLLLLSFQTWAIERTMRGRRERDSFRECDYRTPWKSITLYQFFLKGFQ